MEQIIDLPLQPQAKKLISDRRADKKNINLNLYPGYGKQIKKIKNSGALIGKGRKANFFSKPKPPISYKNFNSSLITDTKFSFLLEALPKVIHLSNNPLALKALFTRCFFAKNFFYNEYNQRINFTINLDNNPMLGAIDENAGLEFMTDQSPNNFKPMLLFADDMLIPEILEIKKLDIEGVINNTASYLNNYSINKFTNQYSNNNNLEIVLDLTNKLNLEYSNFFSIPLIFWHQDNLFISFSDNYTSCCYEIPNGLYDSNNRLESATNIFNHFFQFVNNNDNEISFILRQDLINPNLLVLLNLKDKNPLFANNTLPNAEGILPILNWGTIPIDARSLPLTNTAASWIELGIIASSFKQHDLTMNVNGRFNLTFHCYGLTKELLNIFNRQQFNSAERIIMRRTVLFDSFLLPKLLKNNLFAIIPAINYENLQLNNEFTNYFLNMKGPGALTKLEIFDIIDKNNANINLLIDLFVKVSDLTIKTVNFTRFFGFSDSEFESIQKLINTIRHDITVCNTPIRDNISLGLFILNLIDKCLINHNLRNNVMGIMRETYNRIIASDLNFGSLTESLRTNNDLEYNALVPLRAILPYVTELLPIEILDYNNRELGIKRALVQQTALEDIKNQVKNLIIKNAQTAAEIIGSLELTRELIINNGLTNLYVDNPLALAQQNIPAKRNDNVIIEDLGKLYNAVVLLQQQNFNYNTNLAQYTTVQDNEILLGYLRVIEMKLKKFKTKSVSM